MGTGGAERRRRRKESTSLAGGDSIKDQRDAYESAGEKWMKTWEHIIQSPLTWLWISGWLALDGLLKEFLFSSV